MDSTTKACETGKRNKFKFNPSTYKLAGRKHTAMLSRISKMGVFGIVALMLVVGLTAGDALAARSATVAVGPTALRAASTGNTLTFTITVTDAGVDRPRPPGDSGERSQDSHP